jgi:hypothetical protein
MTDQSPEYAPTEAPTSVAVRILECSDETLHNWRRRGMIHARKTATGRYLWNVREFLQRTECQRG